MSAPTKVRLVLLIVPLAVLLVLRNEVLRGNALVDRLLGAYFALCLFAGLVWVFSILSRRRSMDDTAEMTRKSFKDRIYLP